MAFDADKYEAAKQRRIDVMMADPRHAAVVAALRMVAPNARLESVHEGALAITGALPKRREARKRGPKPIADIEYPKLEAGGAARLQYYIDLPVETAAFFGPPSEFANAIWLRAAVSHGIDRPSTQSMQDEAQVLRTEISTKHRNEATAYLGFIILRVIFVLSGSRFRFKVTSAGSESQKRITGDEVGFLDAIGQALGVGRCPGTLTGWPAMYKHGDAMLTTLIVKQAGG